MAIVRSAADVQARTGEIRQLLDRHRVLETFAVRQQTSKRDLLEQMQRRENLAALQKHVRGLHRADLAAILESLPHRWPWPCLNLITAFAASRVIGLFEGTISRVIALAALMPIVASLGGNTGNQTVALVTRALALDQLHGSHLRLARKELTVSLVNGGLWGAVLGVLAFAVYHSVALGAVMMAAVILNLLVAALAGVAVPLLLHRIGRDPAYGSSVMLTFITDGMGFLLFLGLARIALT